jgi:predicted alpha/beta hydrolase
VSEVKVKDLGEGVAIHLEDIPVILVVAPDKKDGRRARVHFIDKYQIELLGEPWIMEYGRITVGLDRYYAKDFEELKKDILENPERFLTGVLMELLNRAEKAER